MPPPVLRDFPLAKVHHGVMLGNAELGLYVWGQNNVLNLTIGCGSLWDHRGGMSWTPRQNYRDISQALINRDKDAITAIFATDTEQVPGQPRRPSLIPVGRIVITLAQNCHLLHAELHLDDALVRAVYSCRDTEHAAEIRLDMTVKGAFACRCRHLADFQVVPSFDLTGNAMKDISFAPPIRIDNDGRRGFVQPMPADRPFALAARCDGDIITGMFQRADSVSDLQDAILGHRPPQWELLDPKTKDDITRNLPGLLPANWEQMSADNWQWWGDFWKRVPNVNIDNPVLMDIYYQGLFKFAAMTTPDGPPAGLQGPWIEDYALPPWSGDYHFNINIQMCYWPAYRAGLFENLKPLFDMVLSWRDKLRRNANCFLGLEDGYMLPHAVDDHCTCMGVFWPGTIDHACTAWIAQMMFDYVDYTGDIDYLRETVFDFMRGAMRVFQAMLEPQADGSLALPVTVSPEYRGAEMNAWGKNASFQLAAVHRLALNLIQAAKWLNEKPDPAWEDIIARLPKASLFPPGGDASEIGLWDGLTLEESHRHHSHLAGICPFDVIDPDDPQWRPIVARTRSRWTRLGMGLWSGWCLPWAAMLHNRFNNPMMAENILEIWRRTFTNPGGGSLHDAWFPGFSLMASRPEIMQMDATMGALTAVQDMLVHSRQGVIHVLAGASPRWKHVLFQDMPAPGGFRISASHYKHGATRVEVTATRDNTLCLVVHADMPLVDAAGNRTGAGLPPVTVALKAGQTYTMQTETEESFDGSA